MGGGKRGGKRERGGERGKGIEKERERGGGGRERKEWRKGEQAEQRVKGGTEKVRMSERNGARERMHGRFVINFGYKKVRTHECMHAHNYHICGYECVLHRCTESGHLERQIDTKIDTRNQATAAGVWSRRIAYERNNERLGSAF
jgi:hypothetical protein